MDCRVKPGNDSVCQCSHRELHDAGKSTRFPLRAVTERLSASRSCAVGASEFRGGARERRTVSAADRGHRRDALPAGIRNARSTKTSPGSASLGRSRFGGSRCTCPNTAKRCGRLERDGLLYPAFESRAEIAQLVQEREAPPRRGRAIRTARRCIRVMRSRAPIAERKALIESGAPYALRLDMAAAGARAGR